LQHRRRALSLCNVRCNKLFLHGRCRSTRALQLFSAQQAPAPVAPSPAAGHWPSRPIPQPTPAPRVPWASFLLAGSLEACIFWRWSFGNVGGGNGAAKVNISTPRLQAKLAAAGNSIVSIPIPITQPQTIQHHAALPRVIEHLQFFGRGRDDGYPSPPAQIRTCGTTAYGSYQRFWRETAPPGAGGQ